ncbi:MAG TPA: SET domain-containing protein [Candidatus Paceibacterota bacterium]|nr:SET domain-containing protein [Candidatus Paceibacterota bacterium]
MKNSTDQFSFILKPSIAVPGGVGVFALHDIAKDTQMELFLSDFEEILYSKEEVPEELQGYCLDQDGGNLLCPKYFNRQDIGNYLNHSAENANLRWDKDKGYFATRDIVKGEELLADYRQLEEPEATWEEYYKK